MRITILGTGTSQGVPIIGCDCAVCQSTDPKDNRLRCAVHIQSDTTSLLIDVGPDFRQQMLREKIRSIDAILITHEHTDHMIGMDDVRPLNFKQGRAMPIHATPFVQQQLIERFSYAFMDNPYPGAPSFDLIDLIPEKPFVVGDITIIPIPVVHGELPVLGFRIEDFTYITDANRIPDASWDLIKGTKYLVLNALHHKKHRTHYNLTEALEVVERINPAHAFLTHVSHNMGLAAKINPTLPDHVRLAYDGQIISW